MKKDSYNKNDKLGLNTGRKDTLHHDYAEREHRLVFRQSSELCLIWLHDILHISHQAQRPLFALVLTPLSHALIPWLNSHLPLQPMHPAASISFYPSCLALSSLVLSCLILPISCPCYPYLFLLRTPSLSARSLHALSVSSSFPSLPLLWRSAMMQSQRARPCLITLIKHPVR